MSNDNKKSVKDQLKEFEGVDKGAYKQYLCEISFIRDWQEHGTYPIHASSEEHAKLKALDMFEDMRNVNVHDTYPFEMPKDPKTTLVGFDEIPQTEDDDTDPTIN